MLNVGIWNYLEKKYEQYTINLKSQVGGAKSLHEWVIETIIQPIRSVSLFIQ